VSLGDLESPILSVSVEPKSRQFAKEVTLMLGDLGGGCEDYSSKMQAFFNDIEVPLQHAGGWVDGTFLGRSGNCVPSVFEAEGNGVMDIIGEELSRVRLTEGTTTLHAEARHVCTPRRFAMLSPADRALHPGDEVELEWQPATDELTIESVTLHHLGWLHDAARLSDGTLRVEGNRIRFRVPQLDVRTEAPATLSLYSGSGSLHRFAVTRCEGFAQCSFDCVLEDEQDSLEVTLGPR
jgi:hypothetical protein